MLFLIVLAVAAARQIAGPADAAERASRSRPVRLLVWDGADSTIQVA
jgi:hypothetical protein